MKSTRAVSVCMISYNHGKFIAQAIESILSQQTDFPIELVIGDDFSTDDTYDICMHYASRDRRVRVLERDRNVGVMNNFTRTLKECGSEYVAVCEGDDYWTDARKLQKQIDFLDKNPEFGGAAHQSEVLIQDRITRLFRVDVPGVISTRDLLGARLFHTASILFKREAIDIFAGSPAVLSCDRLLNFCVSFIGPIHYTDDPMCVYRLHGAGMSSTVSVEQLKQDLNCIDYLHSVNPGFPKYRYLAYVLATIGLCRFATPAQRLRYMGLSFIFSFAGFPSNIGLYGSHLGRVLSRKLTKR